MFDKSFSFSQKVFVFVRQPDFLKYETLALLLRERLGAMGPVYSDFSSNERHYPLKKEYSLYIDTSC